MLPDMTTQMLQDIKLLLTENNNKSAETLSRINTSQALMSQSLDAITAMVKAHDETLYHSNGVNGVVASLDTIIEWKKKQEEKADEDAKDKVSDEKEWKRFKWGIYSSLGLVALDLVLHLLKIV